MAISRKIINYLEKNGYHYEVVEHKTTYTAWDTSQTEKIKPQEVVKALVVKLDREWAVALLPANRNLDKKKFLATVNAGRKAAAKKESDTKRKKILERPVKTVQFATESWMKAHLPGRVGAVPPFRHLLKLDVYLDKSMTRAKNIFTGTGEYEFSFRLSAKEFIAKEQPVVGIFGVAKK